MICKKIILDEKRPDVFLETYIINNFSQFQKNVKRPAVIICPGGAYLFLSEREMEFIALSFAARGYHAFVLHYSIMENAVMPRPIVELAKSILILRDNAEEWFIDKDKIIVSGFSAGGHLASSMLTMWHKKFLQTLLKRPNEDFKPNAGVLGYPLIKLGMSMIDTKVHMELDEFFRIAKSVDTSEGFKGIFNDITAIKDFTKEVPHIDFKHMLYLKNGHVWIRSNLLTNLLLDKEDYSQKEVDMYSTDKLVTRNTPPVFIFNTYTDGLVSRADSLAFVAAMEKHNIPVEFHMFSDGVHGLALGTSITSEGDGYVHNEVAMWFDLAIGWLERIF